MVQEAKRQCLDLLETVKQAYDEFKERGPRGGGGDRGGRGYDDHRGGYNHRDRNGSGSYGGTNQQYGGNTQQHGYNQGSYNQGYAGGAQSPQSVQAQGQQQGFNMDPTQVAAWIQYYSEHPDQDPYIGYGGYGAVMAQYFGGQQPGQQQGYAGSPTQQTATGQQNGGAIPPPPPPESDIPPPPPPGT